MHSVNQPEWPPSFKRENNALFVMVTAVVLLASGILLAEERDAIAMIRTPDGSGVHYCSGVCVDPSGLVLTAGHCEPNGNTKIHLSGKEYPSKTLMRAATHEGVTILRAVGADGLAYFEIGGDPKSGDKCYTMGFPSGEFRRAEGRVVSTKWRDMQGVPMIETDFATFSGHSGGPLLSNDKRVIGILSGSNGVTGGNASMFIHRSVVVQALSAVEKKPVVYCVKASWCTTCKSVEQDVATGEFGDYDVRFIDYDRERDKVQAIERVTGRKIRWLPSFYVSGRTELMEKYDRQTVLSWIRATLRLPLTILEDIFRGPPRDQGTPVPSPDQISNNPNEEQPPSPPTEDAAPKPFIRKPSDDLNDVKDKLSQTIKDVKEFKDAGIIGKLTRIDDLKLDISGLKNVKQEIINEVNAIKADREKYKDEPWWYGLAGTILGIVKRRYLNREVLT